MTLKYATTKAAEVSRLVQASLGTLGKAMAGVPVEKEVEMTDAPAAEGGGGGADTPTTGEKAPQAPQQQQGGGGGGKKKKKGKK